YESVAPLFDEIISHRLGLVPLPTDLGLFVPRSECPNCKGEGCSTCTIIYSLNKRGPATVLSGDLEPIGDPKLKPPDPDIPIVKLGEGQALLIYATAILGTGREHAKWQVAHGVGYRFVPMLKAGGKTFEASEAEVPLCQDHIIKPTVEEETVELRSDCKVCKKFADAYGVKTVTVFQDPSKIELRFETDGSLSAKDALFAAFDVLE
ncbi:MAG: DNA-directed RNA polymerase subunit D, partial [Candidatus Thermoplasmatota archaeon]